MKAWMLTRQWVSEFVRVASRYLSKVRCGANSLVAGVISIHRSNQSASRGSIFLPTGLMAPLHLYSQQACL